MAAAQAADVEISGDVTPGSATSPTWTITAPDILTVGANGTGSLTVSGSGLVTAPSTLVGSQAGGVGTVNLNGGALVTSQVSEGLGNGTVTFNGGTLRLSSNQTALFSDFETGDVRFTGAGGTIDTQAFNATSTLGLTGNGSLTKTGNGTLTLNGTSSYTGATTIRGGVLSVSTLANGGGNSSIGASASSASNLVLDGGTLRFTGSSTTSNRGFTLGPGGGTIDLPNLNAFLQFSGSIAMTGSGNRTLTLNAGTQATGRLLGTLSDAADGVTSLTKTGVGTWELYPTSLWTYSGPTTVSGGNLTFIGSGASIGITSAVTVASGATLVARSQQNGGSFSIGSIAGAGNLRGNAFGSTLNLTVGTDNTSTIFSGAIQDNSDILNPNDRLRLIKAGNGTLTLSGNNTYTQGTLISAGTLQIGNGGTTGSITGNVTNNAALIFNRSNALTFNGVISGNGSVTKTGAGNLTLTADNTYTQGTIISAGTLQIGSGSTTGSIAGNVTNNATLVFNRSNALTFNGVISGSGNVTKTGAGNLTLTGNSSYSGQTTVRNGTLTISEGGAINHSSANFTVGLGSGDNATFTLSNGTVSNAVGILGANSSSTGRANVSGGSWTSAGQLQIGNTGNGTLNLSGTGAVSAASVVLASAAAGRGVANLTGGVLSTANLTEGAGNGTVTFNGGTLRLTGNQTALFNGFESGDVTLVSSGGTIDTQSFTVATGLGLSGNGSLTKQGSGSLTLAGINTYAGNTTVSAGTLLVDGTLVNSQTTVRSGATLGGSGQLGSILLEDGGTLAPGSSPGTLTASSLVWNSGGSMMIELGTDAANSDDLDLGDFLRGTGTNFNFTFVDNGWVIGQTYTLLTFTNTTFTLGDFGFTNGGGFDGTFSLDATTLKFTIIPEPSTAALLLLALAAAVFLRRRMAV